MIQEAILPDWLEPDDVCSASVCSVVTRFVVLWVFYITLCIFYIILCNFILFYVLFYIILCKFWVYMCTNHCHRVFTQLQLANISIITHTHTFYIYIYIYIYVKCECVTVYINSVFQLPRYNKIHFSDNFIFEFSQILTEKWLDYLHIPYTFIFTITVQNALDIRRVIRQPPFC
jgi:hypothetical protein